MSNSFYDNRTIFLAFSILLVSCGMSESEVKQIVQATKQAKVAAIEELPKLKDYPHFSYNSEKLADPFDVAIGQKMILKKKMQHITAKNFTQRPDHERTREYLENYSLDTLVMVGTLKKKETMWALVIDKDGIIHKVTKGNYLGQNSGKITNISDHGIDIEELVMSPDNDWIIRKISLAIKN